jgi:hypothetical protein
MSDDLFVSVVQWTGHLPSKQEDVGSSPAGGAKGGSGMITRVKCDNCGEETRWVVMHGGNLSPKVGPDGQWHLMCKGCNTEKVLLGPRSSTDRANGYEP